MVERSVASTAAAAASLTVESNVVGSVLRSVNAWTIPEADPLISVNPVPTIVPEPLAASIAVIWLAFAMPEMVVIPVTPKLVTTTASVNELTVKLPEPLMVLPSTTDAAAINVCPDSTVVVKDPRFPVKVTSPETVAVNVPELLIPFSVAPGVAFSAVTATFPVPAIDIPLTSAADAVTVISLNSKVVTADVSIDALALLF